MKDEDQLMKDEDQFMKDEDQLMKNALATSDVARPVPLGRDKSG